MKCALALAVALLAVAAPAAALAAPSPWPGSPEAYGVSGPTQHMVTMSDGVQLAVDVYYPTDPRTGRPATGPFPIVLSQTPYGKRSSVTTQSMSAAYGGDGYYPYLIRHGYIDVVADVRGSGSSDGAFTLFGPREMQDGVELVRWASRLPRSAGAVGLAGSSYLGLNQVFTAALIGPGSPLKAIFPSTTGNDLYRDLSFSGGIPNTEFAVVFSGLRAGMVTAPQDEPASDPAAAATHPASRAAGFAQLDASLYTEVDTGGPRAFDNAFWQSRAPSAYLDRVVRNGIPAMLLSGWFDVYQRGAALDYAELQNAFAAEHGEPGGSAGGPMTPTQQATGRYQLVVGPWFHNPATLGERFQQIQLAWFDRWLKSIPDGIDGTNAPLHVFETGAGRWVNAVRYPISSAHVTPLYLGGGRTGTAPASLNDGALTDATSRAPASDSLPYSDARSPCDRAADQWNTGLATYAVALAGLPGSPCSADDRSTQAGALTYTTAPFARPTSIAGPVDATLYLTSTARDAEVVVSVEDVHPDGTSVPLTTGALLGSMSAGDPRRSWTANGRLLIPYHPYDHATPLTPGKQSRLDVEVYPTFARLARGDRLRVTITTGGTALQPSPVQLSGLAGGVYSIERGGAHASFVDVPLADPAALATSTVDWGGCNGGC